MLKCMQIEIIGRVNYIETKEIETIYFGGGTPSILSITEIQGLLNAVNKHYSVNKDAEITLECNPDDLNKEKLISLKKIGINRLSIGIQSFNDKELKWMNRSHNGNQAKRSVKMAQKVGFDNITIDLIYGLPNQTSVDWKKNLKKIFDYNIQHFSAYALTIENKTILKHLINTNKIKPLKDELIINQFKLLVAAADEHGFIHYEISNFGKNGYFSKHNTAYWQSKHYLGIGPSAHSYNGESRSWNVSSNKQYIQKIRKGENYFEVEKLTKNQKYNEYIFTSLRIIWGVNSEIIKDRFGEKRKTRFLKEVKKWEQKTYVKQKEKVFTLTKKGQIFADRIASDLFIV